MAKNEFRNIEISEICNSDLQLTIFFADLDDDDILVGEMQVYITLIMLLDGLGRYISSLETGMSCFIIQKDIFKTIYITFVQIEALNVCYIFYFGTNR